MGHIVFIRQRTIPINLTKGFYDLRTYNLEMKYISLYQLHVVKSNPVDAKGALIQDRNFMSLYEYYFTIDTFQIFHIHLNISYNNLFSQYNM